MGRYTSSLNALQKFPFEVTKVPYVTKVPHQGYKSAL